MDGKLDRLIDWNVQVLSSQLKNILARRLSNCKQQQKRQEGSSFDKEVDWSKSFSFTCPLEEVQDIITLPKLPELGDIESFILPDSIQLHKDVLEELRSYVAAIAVLYSHGNEFHNFEHASHVSLAVNKLLCRIVNPRISECQTKHATVAETRNASTSKKKNHASSSKKTPAKKIKSLQSDLHDHTFGITSDPLTQFACLFAALIHDVDHPGVPNSTLVEEEDILAKAFHNKSVAEQNSVEIAWGLLMQDDYAKLRKCIYTDHEEFLRFRQLTVNLVMATDVMDKELGALRKKLWEVVFQNTSITTTASSLSLSSSPSAPSRDQINRKATIILEHLIQASDVSHTMQHWHVYIKWNERLFHELYSAYQDGRLDKDPSITWYQGGLGFFDFYIIPLAEKLETCGVFGVSSQEFLDYANQNRQEWESKGKELVKGYLHTYEEFHDESFEIVGA